MTVAVPGPTPRRDLTVSVGTILWLAATAVFVLLRLAYLLRAPVGGFELEHLSGAWQAHAGHSDSRFIPTLFQALTALTFALTTSEMPARVLALLATASVPVALYMLRPQLGEAGALTSFLLLAIDGPGIVVGASASALGFDVALVAWLLFVLTRPRLPVGGWAGLGFLTVSAGPLPLPLLIGVGIVAFARGRYPAARPAVAALAGAGMGVLVASFRFGLGWDGLRIPPLNLFSRGFDGAGASATTLQLGMVYSIPVLVAGLAAGAAVLYRARRDGTVSNVNMTLLAWFAVAAAWFVASINANDPVALAGFTMPAALIAGPVLVQAATAAGRADWVQARWLVPAAVASLVLAGAFVVQWAKLGRVGDANEKLLVAGFLVLAASCLGYVAANRDALPTLLVAVFALAVVPLVSATFGVAAGSAHELLPSPSSPEQARELRSIALQYIASSPGEIVVHPSLEDDITWPFRDSGVLLVTARVADDASVVIWPATVAAPPGYAPLAGEWNLELKPSAPPNDFLKAIRWFMNRNSLPIAPTPVAVYVKETK